MNIHKQTWHQGCQFGTIFGAKVTILLHNNFNLALKLIQTGNPGGYFKYVYYKYVYYVYYKYVYYIY